jgi:hypothetical protein
METLTGSFPAQALQLPGSRTRVFSAASIPLVPSSETNATGSATNATT